MAGHSKWANIKRRKGAVDAKRGKLFTKLIREIQVSAKLGGGDPAANPRLYSAIQEAKKNSMPKDNIERAIKRGSGDGGGESYEEVVYEGYGPAGIALLIESLTDNRNRTVSDLRALMTRNSGNLGEAGSVAWMFDKKGILVIKKDAATEEQLMEVALEAGADDIKDEGDVWEILTPPTEFMAVKQALEQAKVPVENEVLSSIPKNTVQVQGEDAEKLLKLIDLLEDMDDVQKVHANFDIEAGELERITSG